MAVNFYIEKRLNKKGEAAIRCSISIQGHRLVTTTGFSIHPGLWDNTTQRVITSLDGKAVYNSKGVSSKFLNARLKKIDSFFSDLENSLWATHENVGDLKSIFQEEFGKEKVVEETVGEEVTGFFDIYDMFTREMSAQNDWSASTNKKMKTLRNHLYDFKQGLSFEDLNEEGLNFEGATLMRPLVFDFPNDAKALSLKQTYMFGKALLVNPVTEGGVSQWTTYLPVNKAGWYNFRSNRHYPGGQEVTTATDLSYIPVFVRGGSILPYGPTRQYATQTTDEPLEIRVYPGADATFTLYEDDGCSNNYRQGKCSRTPLSWDQTRKRLTIGARQGSYDGMAPQRSLKITVIGSGTKDIVYKGKKTTVTF